MNNPEFAQSYLLGPRVYAKIGRPQKIDLFQRNLIMDIITRTKRVRQSTICQMFHQEYYGEGEIIDENKISTKKLRRIIKEEHCSLKVPEYRNINCNPIDGYNYLMSIAHIDPNNLIDIDESASSLDDFGNGKGYAPIGQKLMRVQFFVRGESFTVVAAATPLGFLFTRIYRGGVDEEAFIDFLNFLALRLYENESYAIIDNAAIHRTIAVRLRLEEIFNGNYSFCATYSPHLKPIEKMFKLVKEYISFKEFDPQMNHETPDTLITEAFDQYRIGGRHADSCFGCWNDYFVQHNNFLNGNLI